MEKFKLRKPFFVVNPKSYLYGEEIYKLAKKTDELCEKYDFDCLFTAQLIDLPKIIADCPHLVPCAQFMESLKPGRGMGHVLPEALAAAGVKATFLNHAENPMTVHELAATIARANEVGILTVVCADSVEEGKAIAELHPDVMVSPETQVLQAAGIHNGANVYDAIKYGADGTGGTSGIVAAEDPFATLDEMFEALDRARTEAANALLKALEEPSPSTLFVLLTPQREQILPTLVSRSFCFTLPWPDPEQADAETAALQDSIADFLETGRGLFAVTGQHGFTAAQGRAMLTAVQKSLLRVMARSPHPGHLEHILGDMPPASQVLACRFLYEAENLIQAQVTPARAIEAFMANLFVLLNEQKLR